MAWGGGSVRGATRPIESSMESLRRTRMGADTKAPPPNVGAGGRRAHRRENVAKLRATNRSPVAALPGINAHAKR